MPNNTVHRSATHPAHPHRRHEGRQDHRHRARELVRQPARAASPEAAAVQTRSLYAGPEPHDGEPARGARPARGERDARAQRSARPGGAGDRDGRDGREARHGSDRVPHRQRHAGRAGQSRPSRASADPQSKADAPGRSTIRIRRSRSGSWSSACGRAPGASAGTSATRSPAACATGAGSSAWAWPRPIRDNLVMKSAARVRLDRRGMVTVETDMTDIGTGSYTVIAQTAAEMMGVPLDKRASCAWAIRASRCRAARAGSGAATARPPASMRPA